MLKNLNGARQTAALNSLIYTVKCIEEKLSIESEFKGGSPQILDCEHQVMQNLQRLYGNAEILKPPMTWNWLKKWKIQQLILFLCCVREAC